VSLSWLGDFTTSVGAPRVAAIDYPGSQPLGPPGDADGQRAVLRAALALLEQLEAPGRVELPFVWPAGVRPYDKPRRPPPIARHIVKRPWLLRNLLVRKIPSHQG
jgi:hypothetical protein